MERLAGKYGGKDKFAEIRKKVDDLRPQLVNEDGDTLLHLAIRLGDATVVKYLIEDYNLNLNKVNKHQDSALHEAAKQGKY